MRAVSPSACRVNEMADQQRYVIGRFEALVLLLVFVTVVVMAVSVGYNVGHADGERAASDSLYVEEFLRRADSIIIDVARTRIERLLGQ